MKIIYKRGDFLESGEEFLLHGCNAQGVMGSGAALAVKRKYPEAYAEYRWEYENGGLVVGDYVLYKEYPFAEGGVVIVNAITQEYYGRDPNVVYVSYEAVEKIMKELDKQAQEESYIPRVAMPKIGSGHANGDWNIIEKIIEDNSNFFQPVVYVLE
jgi:O-acetyl-ADP-ribose deacetylase (regulator of RNase III)